MDKWFEELSSLRKEWVQSTRKNGFEQGIRHSTIEKYPDPAHFIYELLQNAEDQSATRVQFQLFPHQLVFSHNGSPFTRQDVDNITSIGSSSKSQEANKIGRFGIGFKSVFAITDQPEISTVLEGKPFAFAIQDLVVPVSISGEQKINQQWKTQFLFPFIVGQKHSIFLRIKERLIALGPETLLFLQNLKTVEWQVEADRGIYTRKSKESHYELGEEYTKSGQRHQKSSRYLVFTRSVDLSETQRALDVRLAFKLDEEGKVCSEQKSNLAVYFPTEQSTGLHFRLHGPFLLTDNRANIKSDNETNSKLIEECALLLVESIQKIKDAGLLTVDFLALLPINREPIPDQFHPVYDSVLNLLKQRPLLPTTSGIFASALQMKLARSTELRDLLNEQQLSSLYGPASSFHWLSSEITADRTPDLYTYVTKDLKVEVIHPEAFIQRVEKRFLEKQTDKWMVKFYLFLSRHRQPRLNQIINAKPFLRLEDNTHVTPFQGPYTVNKEPNAYLLREGESQFPIVKRSLLANEEVYHFLKNLGLSEPNIVDEVLDFILPSYNNGKVTLERETDNRQDLSRILRALEHPGHHARRGFLLSSLEKTPFIRAHNAKTRELAWKRPCDVASKTEELALWFEGNKEAWFLPDLFPHALLSYLNIPPCLRPRTRPRHDSTGHVVIFEAKGDHRRGLHGFDPDAKLDGLQYALEHITVEKARMLWKFLLEHRHLVKGTVETSRYQNFQENRQEEKFSHIGQICNQKAWLPDQDGSFHIPSDIFLRDLPDDFEKDTHEAYEIAIKLGLRQAEELQLASKLHIPHELIPLIQRDSATLLAWYREQEAKKPLLPSSLAPHPDLRKEKAAEVAFHAEIKTYKAVTANRRVSEGRGDTKAYLRSHNTNENDLLICQLCNQLMPFRLPNGEEYFEIIQYINELAKEYQANHLALCPNCAAEFQHACQTSAYEKANRLLRLDARADESNLVVSLDLPVHRHLRFTQRHLIDLQMVLEDVQK